MHKNYKKIFSAISLLLVILVAIKSYQYYFQNNTEVNAPVRSDIKVVLYSIDSCIYCIRAESLLKSKNIPYEVVKLSGNKDLAMKLYNQTKQNTVPYVFVNDEFIGGYQDLAKLDDQGKL